MKPLNLRPLRVSDEASFIAAIAEFKDIESDFEFAFQYNDSMNFSDYVELVNGWPHGKGLPDKFVPNTYLVGILDENIIGRISLRHQLTDFLINFGGHIGYGVIPSKWNCGYASQMLKATLPIALGLGINQVLVTCDENNFSSQKVIEKVGGYLENIVQEPGKAVRKMRYWINCH